jgi:predicted transport protein
MGDLKLFDLSGSAVQELRATSLKLEKHLQTVFEENLETILGVRFLASEYVTSDGRMDTLGIDENGYPVIIEYKRHQDQNVINQGLFYLNWLMDHKAAFELLVRDKLGLEVAKTIEWSSPRLICIAGNFKKYDTFAVKQMPRNIELIRFALFNNDKLLLDQLTSTSGQKSQNANKSGNVGTVHYRTVSEDLEGASASLVSLYDETHEYLSELGDDVQQGITKFYIAYKRIKNFACMEIKRNVGAGVIRLYLKVDPESVNTDDGFARDVRDVGHYGTGDLELTIANSDDLERAKPLILRSYEAS